MRDTVERTINAGKLIRARKWFKALPATDRRRVLAYLRHVVELYEEMEELLGPKAAKTILEQTIRKGSTEH